MSQNIKKVVTQNTIWQKVYDDALEALRVTGLSLEGDIQIGAVEIKNRDTDDRMVVETDGSINVNVVSTVGETSGTESDASSDEAGDGMVDMSGSEDTILSIPVAAGTKYNITAWDWGASKEATFVLKVIDDITLVKIIRVRGSNGSLAHGQLQFPTPIEITGGENISIVCTAENNRGEAKGKATCGINGFLT